MNKSHIIVNKQHTLHKLADITKRLDDHITQVQAWFDAEALPDGLLGQQLIVLQEIETLIAMVKRIGENNHP